MNKIKRNARDHPVDASMDGSTSTPSSSNIDLQNLIAEKEQASHRLGSLSSSGERLFPETASQGREKIRQDLKTLRSRWEELEGLTNESYSTTAIASIQNQFILTSIN